MNARLNAARQLWGLRAGKITSNNDEISRLLHFKPWEPTGAGRMVLYRIKLAFLNAIPCISAWPLGVAVGRIDFVPLYSVPRWTASCLGVSIDGIKLFILDSKPRRSAWSIRVSIRWIKFDIHHYSFKFTFRFNQLPICTITQLYSFVN